MLVTDRQCDRITHLAGSRIGRILDEADTASSQECKSFSLSGLNYVLRKEANRLTPKTAVLRVQIHANIFETKRETKWTKVIALMGGGGKEPIVNLTFLFFLNS